MEKHISNESTGINCTLHGDYYLPDFTLPESMHEIGRFGRMRGKYLNDFKPVAYTELLTSGKLNAYLHDIDTQAQELFDRMVSELAKRQGVTERLKAENQMEWVGRMNNIRNAAEEVVLHQIVYG